MKYFNFSFNITETKRKNKKKINKSIRFWVREIFKKRNQHGLYNNLIQELRFGDREFYFKSVYKIVKLIIVSNNVIRVALITGKIYTEDVHENLHCFL